MDNNEIWALSGFLGLPSDWDILGWKNLVSKDWQGYSLNSFNEWAEQFNEEVCRTCQSSSEHTAPRILMGYSMGGRLALHALIQRPDIWQGAIIISAHPGLSSCEEKAKRLERDKEWAARFESDDWEGLMRDWNFQEIFAHDSFCFERRRADHVRDKLAQALVNFSLGKQHDLRSEISKLSMPIVWVTGSLDKQYCALAEEVKLANPLSRKLVIEGAGHRVVWGKLMAFSSVISNCSFLLNNG